MNTNQKKSTAELTGYANISMFRCLSTKQPPYSGTLEQVHQLIVADAHLKEQTERYRYFRTQGFESDADRIKRTACLAFTPAALFEGKRQYQSLVSFTGYSMVDYDHLTSEQLTEALERLSGDPYWALVYVTLSGRGLRIIFRVEGVTDRGTYAKAFLQGNAHYARLLGLEYDGQVCDATRMSGLSHDPNALYRPTAEALPVDYNVVTVGEVLPKVERRLHQRGIAYGAHSKNEYISQACYLLNKYGVAEADAMTWAVSTFTDYADEGGVERIVRSCYGHHEEHATLKPTGTRTTHRADTPTKYATVGEIEEFLTEQGEYRFNTVTYKCELRRKGKEEFRELTDREANTLWSRMCKRVKPVRLNDLYNVLHSEFVSEYNPFQAYFDSLPPWDGETDHIAALARTVHLADSLQQEMFIECFRKWLVAMVPTCSSKKSSTTKSSCSSVRRARTRPPGSASSCLRHCSVTSTPKPTAVALPRTTSLR
ncbi:MAG: hypothetical protein IJ456_10440 [Bacteroides sp.]|nr:hypothetical protein [Bacteroides sp.]